MLLFDECIPREVVEAIAILEVPCMSVRSLGLFRTPDDDLPALAKANDAIFVTYDLDFTTSVLLAAMATAGVCVVMIRRPKGADFGHTAEIILRNMRNWPTMCGGRPSIISCNLRTCRVREVSTLPHLKGR